MHGWRIKDAKNLRMGGYTADRSKATETLDRVNEMFPILAERNVRPLPAVTVDPGAPDPGQHDMPGSIAFRMKMDRRIRSQTHPFKGHGNMRESGIVVGQS